MTGTAGVILIAEDDDAIAQGLALNLRLEGFTAHIASDGEEALAAARAEPPDLMLLDISMPRRNGLEVLRALREEGDATPIIVLSARQDEFDKVAALRLGADDYVTKPFSVAELLARINSVLRRSIRSREKYPANATRACLSFSRIEVDLEGREVRRGGEVINLTHLEFELLRYLVGHPAKVFRRDHLLHSVWGVRHSGSPRTVDNFIGQLRSKLEEDPNNPRHFLTVRGSGYRFDP